MPLVSPRDQAALDRAVASGQLNVASAATTAELDPREAVFLSLARHLARVSARIDAAKPRPVSFVDVLDAWPDGTQPAKYPRATLLEIYTSPRDGIIETPATTKDPVSGELVDVISTDGAFALWQRGEDVGEGAIAIVATTKIEARALAKAVRESLSGNLDDSFAAWLPLPEAAIPPPFRDQPAVVAPTARVSLRDGGSATELERDAELNAWRVDVHFAWQAPRLEARPRLPDLRVERVTRVGPAPGEEI